MVPALARGCRGGGVRNTELSAALRPIPAGPSSLAVLGRLLPAAEPWQAVGFFVTESAKLGRYFFAPVLVNSNAASVLADQTVPTGQLVTAEVLLTELAIGLGLVRLLRTNPRKAAMLLGPVPVAYLAAVLHLYPFSAFGGRLLLWLLPILLLLAAVGVVWVAESSGRFSRRAGPVVLILALMVASHQTAIVYLGMPTPQALASSGDQRRLVQERLKPVLQPGDLVAISPGADEPFFFYAPEFRPNRPYSEKLGRCESTEWSCSS